MIFLLCRHDATGFEFVTFRQQTAALITFSASMLALSMLSTVFASRTEAH